VATSEPIDAIKRIGRLVAEYRAQKAMSQAQVADQIKGSNRTMIALLEQGIRLPASEQLEEICTLLAIPRHLWIGATHQDYLKAMDFEEQLSELIGKPVSIGSLDAISQNLAIEAISQLLSRGMSSEQAHAHFNSILTFYGEKSVSRQFFDRFLTSGAFTGIDAFKRRVEDFQKIAIRIYGSFRQAFKTLRSASDIEKELSALRETEEVQFTQRRAFSSIQKISPDRLDDLGYISAERVRKESRERNELSEKLTELATALRASNKEALANLTKPKRRNRVQALLRKFDSKLEISDPLFGTMDLFETMDPSVIEKEAKRVAPEDQDLARIEGTQQVGLRNLAAYLTEPYMDVYIATSMRERADFISVNNFVEALFSDAEISHLHLRYFNPTQSWIADRVAKGLVEALMLKRARLTVYMAQKGDTFGKDSEASVALGQGKPVIVYVPRLFDRETGIDSDALMSMTSDEITQLRTSLELEEEEGIDRQAEVKQILTKQLKALSPADFARLIDTHWADFDLYGELKEITDDGKKSPDGKKDTDSKRDSIRRYLNDLTLRPSGAQRIQSPPEVIDALTERLVEVAIHFEKRAKTFREIHPLALQVILSSGVLNGILVVRSAVACAKAIHRLLTNRIETELIRDQDNYRLIEVDTRSTLRVISKHKILTNAFWTQYFED
jgi:transcriptional regulator with XRE-family HTH domain